MACPHHSHSLPHLTERQRPPSEQETIQEEADQLATDYQEGPYALLLASIVGSGVLSTQLPISSEVGTRAAVRTRFQRFDAQLSERYQRITFRGAELGRETTVRRYGLDARPVFTDGGSSASVSNLPYTNQVRRDLTNGARQDQRLVRERQVRDLSRAIFEASEAGLDREEIRDRLRERLEATVEYESTRIADSQLSTGIGRGQLSALEDDPSTGSKTWRTQRDESVRPAHIVAEQQTVPLGSLFSIGGERARWPGDYRLSPALRLGCRCFLSV